MPTYRQPAHRVARGNARPDERSTSHDGGCVLGKASKNASARPIWCGFYGVMPRTMSSRAHACNATECTKILSLMRAGKTVNHHRMTRSSKARASASAPRFFWRRRYAARPPTDSASSDLSISRCLSICTVPDEHRRIVAGLPYRKNHLLPSRRCRRKNLARRARVRHQQRRKMMTASRTIARCRITTYNDDAHGMAFPAISPSSSSPPAPPVCCVNAPPVDRSP